MLKSMRLLSLLSFLLLSGLLNGQTASITSPDGSIKVQVEIGEDISLQVLLNGQTIIADLRPGMEMDGGRTLGLDKPELKSQTTELIEEERTMLIPFKDAQLVDHYNQLQLSFTDNYFFFIRAYDDGIAYRFCDDGKKARQVVNERINLRFPEGTSSYFPQEESMYSHNERSYLHKALEDINNGDFCSLPVLFENEVGKVLFTEAALHNYPGMFLEKKGANAFDTQFPKYVLEAVPNEASSPDRNQIIAREADYIAEVNGRRVYPWRAFVVGAEDAVLVESNLISLLSDKSRIQDASWIRPGKVAWDWYNANNIYGVDFTSGLNQQTYQYYIDFASENGIEYVILDEGWTKSTTEILDDNPEMDVPTLIKYAEAKGVGIILWVLWKPLQEDVDGILKLYSDWGAKGIKVDFMQRNDQAMVRSYEQIAAVAEKYHLLVDFHGAFKPAGIERVWPNVVNYEGVKGNEHNKWSADINPEHNVTIPFIRMAAGPIDFTPGSMLNTNEINYQVRFDRPMSLGTRAHQVAMYMIYEAPLQMMCESPSVYREEQETVDYITRIPTTWHETKVLDAKVSDYLVVARRHGEQWYIGAMTDWTARDLNIDLSFLDAGRYQMDIYQDGVNAGKNAEDYQMDAIQVDRNTSMRLPLASGGGWSAILTRIK